jgi:hypothetical protein
VPPYRKLPVTIQAERWDGTPASATRIIDWVLTSGHTARYRSNIAGAGVDALRIDTLEGAMTAAPGDWIIQGIRGEFYPCRGDIFAETYEPAD